MKDCIKESVKGVLFEMWMGEKGRETLPPREANRNFSFMGLVRYDSHNMRPDDLFAGFCFHAQY